jgi:light-independent protochlorophyllide reductase subunit B
MVIAPPTHIENHLLGYRPFLGFDGADHIADTVYTTATLGMEKHLLDLFGDAGLEYEKTAAAPLPAEVSLNGHSSSLEKPALEKQLKPEKIIWTADAESLLKKVPFFVRGRVRKNTEKFAFEQGYETITAEVLQAAREALGG